MDPYSMSCLLQVYKPWDPEVIWKDVIYTFSFFLSFFFESHNLWHVSGLKWVHKLEIKICK